jgi:hypothetical protein
MEERKMTLIGAALKILKRDMEKFVEMEKEDKKYHPQENYLSCRDRIEHGFMKSAQNTINFIALNACKDAEDRKNINTQDEQDSLRSLLSDEDKAFEAVVKSEWRD